MADDQHSAWPELPEHSFVSGRPATPLDVEFGQAGFSLHHDGRPVGVALSIEIPQYAWFTEGGQRLAVVVIQAEQARGQRLIAARRNDGELVAGLFEDFELLGRQHP